jgi:rare lipoprotein A
MTRRLAPGPSALALTAALFTVPVFAQSPAPAPASEATPAAQSKPAPEPKAAAAGDSLTGLAAVYSSRLNGHKTASGQTYKPGELTAAHPTLPFGTKVKVTNTKNNRSVIVRINDRGPTQAGRVIDISQAAAKSLGIGKNAMAEVQLEVVEAKK